MTVCRFVVLCYLKPWYQAMVASAAPRLDFEFMRALADYTSVDAKVSAVACNKFALSLWYLCAELLALAFFDPFVSTAEKREMVKRLSVSIILWAFWNFSVSSGILLSLSLFIRRSEAKPLLRNSRSRMGSFRRSLTSVSPIS